MKFGFSALLVGLVSCALIMVPMEAEAGGKVRAKSAKTAKSAGSAVKGKSARTPSKKVQVSFKRLSAKQRLQISRKSQHGMMLAKRGPVGARVTRVASLPSTLDSDLALYSSAALVVNEVSGERIYEKNAQSVQPIASITKLMTAMVVLDMHLPLDELVQITDYDVDTLKYSGSRLLVGTTLTRGEMLHLALMSSENRAAHALARTAPGGLETFVARMNRTAQSLGMRNTHFVDPTGLNSGNVSTPEDLVRLVQAAHHYPEIRSYSTSDGYTFVSSMNGREYTFHNTNPLVKAQNWDIGVSKTGFISEAGKCLVMQAVINDSPVIMVLLASRTKTSRIEDARGIKRWLETSPGAKLRAG
ncbi:D-alanyl-D-alanine carboxypeptidase family protein [Chitinimonas lacunae]|uniref:D-alanyl-D-alanine carboxypeptidase family protein n=1 Tax=Chitinimonas lacunae TaxID=1963018 RepID=A0ABV8MMJ9_9NEIS